METEGFCAAGDRGALRVPRSRRRYDDELEVRTTGALLSPVRVQFTTRSCASRTAPRWPRARPCTPRSIARGRPCRLPERVQDVVFMKALVTGVAGFIGSTLAERLLADGADVVGIDCFTDYYPRAIKERNLSGRCAHPRFRFVESRIQDADLPALLSDRTHVFHLAAQAGVRKSWGRDFAVYTVNNIEATQVLLEAVHAGRRSSGSSTRRARRCTATTRRCRCARTRCRSRCRRTASRSWRRNSSAISIIVELRRADGLAALLHGLRTAAAARHGLPQVPAGDASSASRSRCTATASRRGTSRSSPTRSARRWRPRPRGVPGRVYNIGGGSRVSINEVLDMIGRVTGRRPR